MTTNTKRNGLYLLHVLHPIEYPLERHAAAGVVAKCHGVGLGEEAPSHRPEALLPRRVPHLHPHVRRPKVDHLRLQRRMAEQNAQGGRRGGEGAANGRVLPGPLWTSRVQPARFVAWHDPSSISETTQLRGVARGKAPRDEKTRGAGRAVGISNRQLDRAAATFSDVQAPATVDGPRPWAVDRTDTESLRR